jgi:hypothetical protein
MPSGLRGQADTSFLFAAARVVDERNALDGALLCALEFTDIGIG